MPPTSLSDIKMLVLRLCTYLGCSILDYRIVPIEKLRTLDTLGRKKPHITHLESESQTQV